MNKKLSSGMNVFSSLVNPTYYLDQNCYYLQNPYSYFTYESSIGFEINFIHYSWQASSSFDLMIDLKIDLWRTISLEWFCVSNYLSRDYQ